MFNKLKESFGCLVCSLPAVISCALVSVNTNADETKKVSICYTEWGDYGGENLPGKGIIPDLTTRVLEHAGYDVEVLILPWARCVRSVKFNKIDLIASAWRGKNFDPDFEYFDITWENDVSFVVNSNSALASGDINDMSGLTIGHVRDSGGMDELRENPSIQTHEVTEMDTLVKLLANRRIDAVLSDPPSLFAAARQMDPDYFDQLRVLEPPLLTNYNSPLVSNTHPEKDVLRDAFNSSLRTLITEGLYSDLIAIHGEQIRFDIPRQYR